MRSKKLMSLLNATADVEEWEFDNRPMLDPRVIMKAVENRYFLAPNSLCTQKRGNALSEARAVAYYICRKFTRYSLTEIARVFKKDHKGVMLGITKMNAATGQLKDIINEIEESINEH